MDPLPASPTPNQIDEVVRRFNDIGDLVHNHGVKTRLLREKLIAERKAMRRWLQQHAPERLPLTGPATD